MIINQQLISYDNLIHRYDSLKSLPGFVLLRSHPKSRGRYDILAALPVEKCRTLDCNSWIMKWPCFSKNSELPFLGGVIGWVSYEATLNWLKLELPKSNLIDDLPLLELAYFPGAIIVDHQLKKATLVWHQGYDQWQHDILQAWENASKNLSEFKFTKNFIPTISYSTYQSALSKIQEYIVQGRVYQVNYTQAFIGRFQGDSFRYYLDTQNKNPVHYGGFYKGDDYQLLSFSPECFIQIENLEAITQPIKGTIARGKTPVEDLHNQQWLKTSEKNLAENIMIVDLLRNDFGKMALPGSVNVPSYCALETYENVFHLVSEVRAKLDKKLHPWLFAQSCMPGGSITGTPKIEAIKVISELEPYTRGAYCGHLFYLSCHGRFDSNIMIRTAIAKQNQMVISAGGGIVIDSDIPQEYEECLAKIQNIIPQNNALNV